MAWDRTLVCLFLVLLLFSCMVYRDTQNKKKEKPRKDTGQKFLLLLIVIVMFFNMAIDSYEAWQIREKIEAKTPTTRRESAMKGNAKEMLTRFIENLETIDHDPHAMRERVEAVFMTLQKNSDAVRTITERYKSENPFTLSLRCVVSDSIVLVPDATEERWDANYIVEVDGQQRIHKSLRIEVEEGYIKALGWGNK